MNSGVMTWEEHLRELKRRTLVCVVVFLIAVCFGFGFRDVLLRFVLQLGEQAGYNLVFLAPEEVLVQQLKLALGFGIVVVTPVVVVQMILFVTLGKKKGTRVSVLFCGLMVCFFYLVGAWFGVQLLLPTTLTFLFKVSKSTLVQNMVSIEKFTSFVLTFLTGLGIVFEIPVVCSILTVCGFLTVKTLRKFRSWAVVVIFVVAAIITPPDVVSQFMVAIPMVLLYELSILIAASINRLKRRKSHETVVSKNEKS